MVFHTPKLVFINKHFFPVLMLINVTFESYYSMQILLNNRYRCYSDLSHRSYSGSCRTAVNSSCAVLLVDVSTV